MQERHSPGIEKEKRTSHLYQLYADILDKGSLNALRELSCMAAGGSERAAQLVNRIDEAVCAGELELVPDKRPSSVLLDSTFLLTHPITALKAFRRTITVALETEAPPSGWTFEEFSELSLSDAARAVWDAKPRGGVPLNAWSSQDQKRLQNGGLPKGYPEHPNV